MHLICEEPLNSFFIFSSQSSKTINEARGEGKTDVTLLIMQGFCILKCTLLFSAYISACLCARVINVKSPFNMKVSHLPSSAQLPLVSHKYLRVRKIKESGERKCCGYSATMEART